MADINFFEPEQKDRKRKRSGMLPMIILLAAIAAPAGYFSLTKITEYADMETRKKIMDNYIKDKSNQRKVAEYASVQADIARAVNEKKPIMDTYVNYRLLNTVTGSLLNDYIWAPIRDNPDSLEFKAVTVAGNNVTITAQVADIIAMRGYQARLAEMKVKTDRYNIDKMPGADDMEGDAEINKFRDQFTTQIVNQPDPNYKSPYEGLLSIFINKDLTAEMLALLGKGQ